MRAGQVTEADRIGDGPPCLGLGRAVCGRQETGGADACPGRCTLRAIGRAGRAMPVSGRPNLGSFSATETPRPLCGIKGRAAAII